MRFRSISGIIAVTIGLMAVPAVAAIANFDSMSIGFAGSDFVDGGIRFYDMVGTRRGFTIQGPLTFDSPAFSSPNVLGVGDGYLTPGILAYAPVNSYKIALASPGLADHASVELWTTLYYPGYALGNTITLEAWRQGAVVNSITYAPPSPRDEHHTLSLSGVQFDYLHLVGSGPAWNGVFYAVLDNVTITPEPASTMLLLTGLAALRRRMGLAVK
jgi:hypothetical protein